MEYAEALDKIEARIRELKRDYELYFKGDLRREPILEREKLSDAINKALAMHVPNTQLKFRAQSLSNSFIALCRYWARIVLQIETGTYRPDVFKADMRVGRINPDTKEVEQKRPSAEATPKPRPAPASAEDRQLRGLYSQFIEARRVTGENTSISFDAFKQSVDKQRPLLEKKLGNRVRLKVVIEDGKVKIKGAAG